MVCWQKVYQWTFYCCPCLPCLTCLQMYHTCCWCLHPILWMLSRLLLGWVACNECDLMSLDLSASVGIKAVCIAFVMLEFWLLHGWMVLFYSGGMCIVVCWGLHFVGVMLSLMHCSFLLGSIYSRWCDLAMICPFHPCFWLSACSWNEGNLFWLEQILKWYYFLFEGKEHISLDQNYWVCVLLHVSVCICLLVVGRVESD